MNLHKYNTRSNKVAPFMPSGNNSHDMDMVDFGISEKCSNGGQGRGLCFSPTSSISSAQKYKTFPTLSSPNPSNAVAFNELLSQTTETPVIPEMKLAAVEMEKSHVNKVRKAKRAMIFDVETTGLPKHSLIHCPPHILEKQPYIIQLSYIIADIYKEEMPATDDGTSSSTFCSEESSPPPPPPSSPSFQNNTSFAKETNEYRIVKEVDAYVKLPANVIIPSFISNLTGITTHMCEQNGKPMSEILFEFCKDYIDCEVIIAHNVSFDSKMILIELSRHCHSIVQMGFVNPHCIFSPIYNVLNHIEVYCTMMQSISVCNLKTVKGSPKNPKLNELFSILYPDTPLPDNLHNANVDAWVCYYCYLRLTRAETILPPPPPLSVNDNNTLIL